VPVRDAHAASVVPIETGAYEMTAWWLAPVAITPQTSRVLLIPLPVATQDTAELIRYALRGIEYVFREGYRYQKTGIILTGLVPAHQVQPHLFDQKDRERSRQLMAAIDGINREWGSGTICYAAVGLKPGWLMRCARRSPRYTTR